MRVERTYFADGTLEIETHYNSQNQRHGRSIGWYTNGQIRWEENYVNGQRHGKSLWWYDNGQKYVELGYCQGQRHGKNIMWHTNGQKEWEVDYRNGKAHGKYILWPRYNCENPRVRYYLYGNPVSEEEYRKHQLIEKLAGLRDDG